MYRNHSLQDPMQTYLCFAPQLQGRGPRFARDCLLSISLKKNLKIAFIYLCVCVCTHCVCVHTVCIGKPCYGEHTPQELVRRGSWVQKGLALSPFTLWTSPLVLLPTSDFKHRDNCWKLPHCEACKNTPCKKTPLLKHKFCPNKTLNSLKALQTTETPVLGN